MNKQEFLERLQSGLSGLPKDDVEERLNFYSEIIEDRIEEGFSEEEAVWAIGSVDEIVAQTIKETPILKIVKKKIKSKRKLSVGERVLFFLGSPLWLPLLIAAFAVIFSLYISLWAVIISFWAVFASFTACSVGSIVACIIFITSGHVASGIAVVAAGLICAGLTIFIFHGCKAISTLSITLTRKMAIWIKNCFINKEEA
jgi:uncharacterized membrane protein